MTIIDKIITDLSGEQDVGETLQKRIVEYVLYSPVTEILNDIGVMLEFLKQLQQNIIYVVLYDTDIENLLENFSEFETYLKLNYEQNINQVKQQLLPGTTQTLEEQLWLTILKEQEENEQTDENEETEEEPTEETNIDENEEEEDQTKTETTDETENEEQLNLDDLFKISPEDVEPSDVLTVQDTENTQIYYELKIVDLLKSPGSQLNLSYVKQFCIDIVNIMKLLYKLSLIETEVVKFE